MLKNNIIDFFKKKGWWSDSEIPKYRNALEKLAINTNHDDPFIQFYLHVEDMPTFINRGEEIYQLGWFLTNTNLIDYLYQINDIFGLSKDYIALDSFEGESGYFYNKNSKKVIRVISGQAIPETSWESFNDFLEYFFEI